MSRHRAGLSVLSAGVIAAAGLAAHIALGHGFCLYTPAAEPNDTVLPATPAGSLVSEFIAAVNDGSARQIEAFETKRRSEARSSAVPLNERVTRLQALKDELGPIKFVRVVDQSETSLWIVAEGKGGQPLTLEFNLDAKAKDRYDGVSIEVGPGAATRALTPDQRAATVEAAAKALEEGYVFPETGKKMAELARARLKEGKYDAIRTDAALARVLTEDFRSISKDLHLGVRRAPASPGAQDGAPVHGGDLPPNHGFIKLEILPGNIGYIRFDFFEQSPEANKTAAAAMAFVSGAEALIFDLRYNGGGSPEMIRYLTSYLYDSPTHLNDMVDRDGKVVEEYWTLKEVPGERISPKVPVYVLTSGRTFSGAEEFTYNLKNLKRATIVGENTGGGAHPVRGVRLDDGLVLRVPFMRARNPISGTNWEGKGIEPDVKTTAGDALEKAASLAREALKHAEASTGK